jgi:hypothetical protein
MCFPRASTSWWLLGLYYSNATAVRLAKGVPPSRASDVGTGATAKFIDVVFGLLETHARRQPICLDRFDRPAAPQGVEDGWRSLAAWFESNSLLLQQRVQLAFETRQRAKALFN